MQTTDAEEGSRAMDMSKLPRLSQSPEPPPVTPEELSPQLSPQTSAPTDRAERAAVANASVSSTGAEVWISVAIGLILMLIGRTFGTYLISLITHEPMHTGFIWPSDSPKAGQEVAYPDLQGFVMLTDASMWLFGLAMVVDAIVLFFAAGRRLWLVALGFTLTVCVTAFNAYVCARLFSDNITPIMSLLAAAFGVYMAIYQWRLLNDVRAAQAFLRAKQQTG